MGGGVPVAGADSSFLGMTSTAGSCGWVGQSALWVDSGWGYEEGEDDWFECG